MTLQRRHLRYDTVASTDDDDDLVQEEQNNNNNEINNNLQSSQQRTAAVNRSDTNGTYSSLSTNDDNNNNNNNTTNDNDIEKNDDDDDDVEMITITILDFCHTRFNVDVPMKTGTVYDLKQRGSLIHNVHPNQQRLIYQGKLLNDNDKTLSSYGINKNGTIVHLFPKPRVVVVNNNNNNNVEENSENVNNNEDGQESSSATTTTAAAARVPTIIMDQDEVDRRGQILVLGSMDYIETVNNVKLFSFMLLIISSIELLNLAAIALGGGSNNSSSSHNNSGNFIPLQEDDDFFSFDEDNSNSSTNITASTNTTTSSSSNYLLTDGEDPALAIYQTWSPLSYIDLIVSILGIYVALLGIKASNENQLRTARLYLIGTCITAALWLLYNYLMTIQVDKAVAKEMHTTNTNSTNSNDDNDDDDVYDKELYDQAMQVMVLPSMVWFLCIFRAWQFQNLLSEAEQEAAERIMSINNNNNDNNDDEELAIRNNTQLT